MLRELLGEESQELIKTLDEQPQVSVRLDRRKPGYQKSNLTGNRPWLTCVAKAYPPDAP